MLPLVVLPLDPESFLYLSKHLLGRCVAQGALPGWHFRETKIPFYVLIVRLGSGTHETDRVSFQALMNEQHAWSSPLKVPLCPGWDFWTERRTNPAVSYCSITWTVIWQHYSTALTPTAGSVSLVLIVACLKTHLWQVKELAFGFVCCTPPEMLCAAFRLQARSCLPSSEARLFPVWLRDRQTLRCVCAKYCLFKCHTLGEKWHRRGSLCFILQLCISWKCL